MTLSAFAAGLRARVWRRESSPSSEALIVEVEAETKAVADKGKDIWKRPRPNVADPARFSDPGDPEKTPGYPSAHSTRGTVFAQILINVFPDRSAQIIQKRSRDIGWVRVQAGVHTPLDIYAGRVLGQALAQAFMRDAAFQQDLAAAEAEVAANSK